MFIIHACCCDEFTYCLPFSFVFVCNDDVIMRSCVSSSIK